MNYVFILFWILSKLKVQLKYNWHKIVKHDTVLNLYNNAVSGNLLMSIMSRSHKVLRERNRILKKEETCNRQIASRYEESAYIGVWRAKSKTSRSDYCCELSPVPGSAGVSLVMVNDLSRGWANSYTTTSASVDHSQPPSRDGLEDPCSLSFGRTAVSRLS